MVQFKYYIGIASAAIGIFFSSCDSQTTLSKAQCSLSSSDAFDFFKESVRRQDASALNNLCSEHFPYIDTLATVFAKPEIELIPEEKDGAFGIKNAHADQTDHPTPEQIDHLFCWRREGVHA